MEPKYKYFIENELTHKWYVLAFNFEIKSTARNWKPSRPEPEEEDFWTNDPHKAFSFETKKDAEKWIKTTNDFAIEEKSCINEPGWNLLRCIVTEHEFVDIT